MASFKYIKVQLDQTKCDTSYQRPLDVRRATAYSEHFDKGRFGVPVLSCREDGSLWRVDGNTRIEAAILAGHGGKEFMCQVFTGLTYAEESMLFHDLNRNRKAVHAFYRFNSRLQGGEPIAIEIARIVKSCGLKLVMGNGGSSVSAVEKLESAHRQNGNLRETLIVLKEWGGVDSKKFDGMLIGTLSNFLASYPSIDTALLIRALLQTYAPRTLIAHIRQNRIAFNTMTTRDADVMAYRNIYNKKFAKHPLPQNPESGKE